jgi:ABC-type nitrate/sulfonate/bicarbonate transport system substrate-binding protein
MKRKPVLLAIAVVIGSLMVGAFGSDARSSVAENAGADARQQAVPNLRGEKFSVVSTEPGVNTVVLFKAIDYLRQWGAEVEIKHVQAPANVIAAVGAGQVDIGDAPPLVGLQAQQAGLDIKAFAMSQPRTDDVFVSKSSITSLAGLRGATIGVLTTRGLNGVQLSQVLSVANLNPSDVNVVFVGGQTVRVSALIAGRIDATPISFDNYKGILQPQGYNSLYNFASQMPNLLRSFLWAKPSWIAANQNVAAAMNEALLRAFRFVSNTRNRQAFINLAVSRLTGVTPQAAGSTYDEWIKYKIFHPNSAITQGAVQLNQDLFFQRDLISRRPSSVAEWVDIGYSQRALSKLGKIRTRGANKISATLAASGGRIAVTGATGIFNGPAVLVVKDTSRTDNVRLQGPGINRATGVAFRGTVTWRVTLRPGTYTLRSDRNRARGARIIVTETG